MRSSSLKPGSPPPELNSTAQPEASDLKPGSPPPELNSTAQPEASDFWLTLRGNVRLQQQAPSIVPIDRNLGAVNFPLSLNQNRLWALERLQSGGSVYNLLHIFQIKGCLNVAALEQSLSEIVCRHHILCTTFLAVAGHPVQTIEAPVAVQLPVMSLQNFPEGERSAVAYQRALADADDPFDLAHGPLWRFKLWQLDETEYVLARTVHHIIFDGWSHSVFLRELAALYPAFLAGQPSPLPPLPIQYADFASAQQQWFQSNVFADQMGYWQQQLQGDVPPLELPLDYPRPVTPTYRGACQPFELSRELTKALKIFSRQQGVSLFATLLAAFKTLLYCYTEQVDQLVCAPVASRHQPEAKGLIGYFNNVVVMRTDLSGHPSFREVVNRVSQVTLGAYASQDIPLQEIAELPNLRHTPLARAMVVLQNIPSPTLELEGLTIRSDYVERPIANFDLLFSLKEQAGQLLGQVQYKTDLFRDVSITQMLEAFQALLASLVANPDQSLADLPRLRVPHLVAVTGDGSAVERPPESPIETFVAPRDDLEIQLARIWQQVLNCDPIGVHDNLFTLGADSLRAVRLVEKIEQAFCRDLPLVTIFQAPTIAQLAQVLRQPDGAKSGSSLMPIQAYGQRSPLFLCEGVGIYYPLLAYLDADQPVYGLVAGSVKGEPIQYDDLATLAAHYIAEMRVVQPTGPYCLGGISWGGMVAFEVAQQLMAQGEQVKLLALFDTIRPGAYQPLPWHTRLIWHLKKRVRGGPVVWRQTLRDVVQRGMSGHLWRKAQSLEAQLMPMPENDAHFAMREMFNQACRAYQPQPYPGQITLFVASDRVDAGAYAVEPGLGWQALAQGGVIQHPVPGDHLGILQEPHVSVLGQKLQGCLVQVSVDRPAPEGIIRS
jgi:thioesterase domain-containing protein/aryl carrier-like protein